MVLFGRDRDKSFYDKKITVFLKKNFGYVPRKFEVYRRAFRHKSFAESNNRSNERLEFLGDTVLNTVISDYLFKSFPEETEGFLTKFRARLVSRSFLSDLSNKIGLTSVLKSKMNKSQEKLSASGNAFEALVGAMYLDRGYEFTQLKLLRLYKPIIDKLDLNEVQDFKSQVMEWGQKEKREVSFEVINEKGKEHSKIFEVGIYVDGDLIATGEGKSKKSAEQSASESFYRSMMEVI
jgi:ribonuclease III